MIEDECFWHGHEPIPANAYKVCGECWHAWATEDDFRKDVHMLYREVCVVPPSDLSTVFSCPLCTHDF